MTARNTLLAGTILAAAAAPLAAQAQPVTGLHFGAGAGVNRVQDADVDLGGPLIGLPANVILERAAEVVFDTGWVAVLCIGWGFGHPGRMPTPHRAARRRLAGDPGRRPLLALLPALAAAGCEADPSLQHLWGLGDPVRGTALHAPRSFGDTSRWAGQPAQAARVAAQIEFLAQAFRTDPAYAPVADPAVVHRLGLAQAEMRRFLGIGADAPAETVMASLRRAAAALEAGSQARAEAALSGPDFQAGPLVTLARLSAMPRLPRSAEAAGAVAAEIARLDRFR